MATTDLSVRSNRLFSDSSLQGNSTLVALDANVAELFRVPAGYGSILVKSAIVQISALSGAYAAPTPAYDGVMVYVVSPDSSTWVDNIGVMRFVNNGTSSARPVLSASFDLNNHTLVRMFELIVVTCPIIAGAGVTGTVSLVIRGQRFQTA